LKITQEKGFEAIQCMALSVFTQKICSKLGFEEIFRYMTMIIENSPKKCPKMPKYIYLFSQNPVWRLQTKWTEIV
jgi:hypothetical protein